MELNDRELAELGIGEQAFIAYGYQPVMVSAGCIKKTSASCDGKGGVLTILTVIRRSLQSDAIAETVIMNV